MVSLVLVPSTFANSQFALLANRKPPFCDHRLPSFPHGLSTACYVNASCYVLAFDE